MQKWEYHFEYLWYEDPNRIQQYLTDKGNDGWELVSTTYTQQPVASGYGEIVSYSLRFIVFFKRPKP